MRSDLLASLRQLFYPREFRIFRPAWPEELAGALEELTQHCLSDIKKASTASTDNQIAESEHVQLWADLATGLWHLRQRMLEPGDERPIKELRRHYRYLEGMWDALASMGVEVQGHTGDPFVSGMALSVVAFQPSAELEREQVVETIKPSVYFRNEMLQMGEVIVGTPERLRSSTLPTGDVMSERGETFSRGRP